MLRDVTGTEPEAIAAAPLAERLLGDSIAANMPLLGYAWQSGAIPLRLSSIVSLRTRCRQITSPLRPSSRKVRWTLEDLAL
jgi:hypothetical protein